MFGYGDKRRPYLGMVGEVESLVFFFHMDTATLYQIELFGLFRTNLLTHFHWEL